MDARVRCWIYAQQTAIENAFSITAAAGNTNDGTINWGYAITESELNFLGEGEVVTAVFTITVSDDENATATKDVTITINGANDDPVVTAVTVVGSVTEGSGDLNEVGSVTFADVDLTDRPTATEATLSVVPSTGLTLTAAQQAATHHAHDDAHAFHRALSARHWHAVSGRCCHGS